MQDWTDEAMTPTKAYWLGCDAGENGDERVPHDNDIEDDDELLRQWEEGYDNGTNDRDS
jgi:hypothetical protein